MQKRNTCVYMISTFLFSLLFPTLILILSTACGTTEALATSAAKLSISVTPSGSSGCDTMLGKTTLHVIPSSPNASHTEDAEIPTQYYEAQTNIILESSPTESTQSTVIQPADLSPAPSPTESIVTEEFPIPDANLPSVEQIPSPSPTEHQHAYTVVDTAPSCLEKGYATYTCTGCSHRYTEETADAMGHHYTTTVTAPTCTSAGYSAHTCSRCTDTYIDSELEATGHLWSQWTVTTAPTQNSYGQQSRMCSACSKTETHGIFPLQPSASELQQEVLRLVNIERQNAGLSPLSYCHEAQNAADIRVSEIQTCYGHIRPNGTQCYTVIAECGIDVSIVGENIAFGFPSPETIVSRWMDSPGHRANILNANISGLVVGVSGSYWVQLFIR